jgi:lactate permease
MGWSQIYHPLGPGLSVVLAAAPIVVLLGCIGLLHMRAYVAALLGLLTAGLVAVLAFGMPAGLAARAAAFGAAYGLLPIGWIVLNIIFLYQLTNERGQFTILRDSIARSAPTAASSCWSSPSAWAHSSKARRGSGPRWR